MQNQNQQNQTLPAIGSLLDPFSGVKQGMQAFTHPIETLESFLPPIGATIGAMGGAAIPGADLSGVPEIGGAGVGWNVGQEAENALQGEGNPTNLLTPENAVNTALAMGTEGVGRFGTGKFQQKMQNQPLTQFKTTPSDITNFAAKHGSGTGLIDYLTKFKTMFPSWDGTAATFKDNVRDPLMQQYGNQLSGVSVNRADIENAYNTKINNLKRLNPANPNSPQIQALENDRDNTLAYLDNAHNPLGAHIPLSKGQLPPTVYDAQAVNAYKGIKDAQTPGSQFNLNPEESSNLKRTSGDILRQSLYNAADQTGAPGILKQVGKDAKAAEQINNMADDTLALQQAGKFQPGGKPSIMGTILRMPFEAGIGALLSQHLGLPPEVGAAVTPAATEVIARKFGEPIASGVSATLSNPVGKFGARLAAQSAIPGSAAFLENQMNPNGNSTRNNNDGQHGTDYSTYPLALQSPAPINGINISDNYDANTAQWKVPDISSLPTPKDAPSLAMTPYDVSQLSAKYPAYANYYSQIGQGVNNTVNNYLASKGLSAGEISAMNNMPRYQDNLNQIANAMQKVPIGAWNAAPFVKQINTYIDPEFAVAAGLISYENMQSLSSLKGGTPTVYDLVSGSLLPQPTDSKQVAVAKVAQLGELLQKQYATYGPTLKWYQQITTQPGQQTGLPPISQNSPTPQPTIGQPPGDTYQNGQWVQQ